jgi:hypothetical protein
MRIGNNQRGVTFLGFVIILIIAGFFAFIAMRLFPVYSEYYGVVQAMRALQDEPGVAQKSPDQIKSLLERKFYISYVTTPKSNNVLVKRQGGGYLVTVKYEVRGPLAYNLEYIASFERTVDLIRTGP